MRHYWIGALAVLLLAMAPKQIQLVLVPMSDVPTQLFCMLALWCALRASRQFVISSDSKNSLADTRRDFSLRNAPLEMTARYAFAALCGLSLGMAYLIRHSALAMVVPLAIVATRWGQMKRARALLIFVALVVCVLTVLPDVLYHANVLGSIFAVESPESAQTNVYDAPRQFLEMLGALFSVTGFGPLVLLVPFGWWILAREKNGFAALVLASWILAFMVLHAPLRLTGVFENSLRYLMPAYPAVTLSAASAVVILWEWGWRAFRPRRKPYQIRVKPNRWEIALLGAIVALFFMAIALRALVNPERFVLRAYGWMSERARTDLETLNAQLPPNAVIGTSDQMAGATLLYAQREIFRPNNFLEPAREFPQFLELMKRENREVFLLGEWSCAGDASERLPEWFGDYETGDWRLEIRDLPFGCAQRLRAIQE